MKEEIQKILNEEINAIKAIPITGIEDALKLMLECTGKVVITGMGKAGLIGKKIAASLSSTGTSAIFLCPAQSSHGDLGILQKGDIILCLSNSGKTREVIETIALAKKFIPGIEVISITSNKSAELALLADVVIETGGYPEVCPLGMAPSCSTTAMLVIGDVLMVLLMKEKSITLDEYGIRHHGGYLGTVAKKSKAI